MKIKYLISICLIIVFLMSMAGVSAVEDMNKTDDLGLSLDSNLDDSPEIFNAIDNGMNLKENNNLNKNFKSDSNILALSNEDVLAGNNITPADFTFAAIQTAVDSAGDGDTISLQEGTYWNNGNGEININKNISIVGIKGLSILDAQKTSTIFSIDASSINITDIIFMNGNAGDFSGGAIFFNNEIYNSNINATFINNTAVFGGANYFSDNVFNSTITGTYINNTAVMDGGANHFSGNVFNSTVSGTYTNNKAGDDGGANYFSDGDPFNPSIVSNSTVSGTYTNNNAVDGGGANYFWNVLNSTVSGTYTNNKAGYGGANYFFDEVSNTNITGTYTDNNATEHGGANYFYDDVSGTNITGTYINNKAEQHGGAIYFFNNIGNVKMFTVSGIYINNTANGGAIIHFNVNDLSPQPLNSTVKHAIFLNNHCEDIFYVSTNVVVATNNWFGNNASNYKEIPKIDNLTMTNWLFLNATANPSTPLISGSSDVLFKLYSTDGTNVSDFDNTQLPVINLTLTSTNGDMASNTTALDNSVKYTATSYGNGSVTAKIEDVQSTIYLNNFYNVDLSVSTQNITYLENETLTLTYNNTATGKVNITLKSKNYNKTMQEEINQSIIITDLPIGEYNVTVEYLGDNLFLNATAYANFIVGKITTEIITNTTVDLFVGDESEINYTLKPSDAVGDLIFSSNDTNIVTVDSLSCIIKAKSEGSATITVNFSGSENYTASNATITVTVTKVPSEINITNETVNLKANSEVPTGATLNPEEAGNLTYTSSNPNVAVVENGMIKGIKQGEANITVSFAGDDKYDAAENKTIAVSVSLADASVKVINDTLDLKVGDTFVINATTSPEGLNVTYVSDDSGVYMVDENGVVTALMNGTGSIIVSVGDDEVYAKNTTVVTVTVSLKDASVTVNNDTLDLKVGETGEFYAVTDPEDLNITVSSSNESVATVKLVNCVPTVTAVGEGSAVITLTINEKDYVKNSTTVNVGVTKVPTEIRIQNDTLDMVIGDIVDPVVSLMPSDAGNMSFTVSDENIVLVNGHGVVKAVGEGNATVTVRFGGNDKYLPSNATITVTVRDALIVTAPDVVKYYGGPERFVVNVTDSKGTPLSNKSVTIVINKVTYNRTTDENGIASIGLNLHSGTYNATVTVDNKTVNSVVNVLTTVNGTDVVKMYKNDTQYYATFIDSEGKYLADGTTVNFNINGVMYERKISGDKGQAKLNINLPAGKYVITAMNPKTGEKESNNIVVLATIVENRDITKYYKNATQYTVKVLGADGNPVGAGKTVTFNINGVMYKKQTNESGIAQLNINLAPGDYVITASYEGYKVSNNIKVLPVLSASDLEMKYMDGSKFKATLLDGQGRLYAEQKIQFNVNGVLYHKVTDSFGQAELIINLLPGEYIITSSYNGANIANKITITG